MKEINKIVFASDLGKTTNVIVDKVGFLAKQYGAEVILVNAMDGGFYFSELPYDYIEDSEERILNELGKLRECLIEKGVRAHQTIVEIGEPHKVILKTAEKRQADFIVIGASQKGVFERMLGKTAESVIRHASQPVWVIHPKDSLTEINNVLCAVDCTSASDHTLRTAIAVCSNLKAKLTILHVYQHPRPYYGLEKFDIPIADWGADTIPDGYLEIVKDEHGYKNEWCKLAENLKRFDFNDIKFSQMVREGNPPHEIYEAVKESKCDLLVMGVVDMKGPLAHIFKGTVDKLLRDIPCSILTVKHHCLKKKAMRTAEKKIAVISK